MNYSSFSLNGSWDMAYSEDMYTDTSCPDKCLTYFSIPNAVPGYWEDMLDAFACAPFYVKLRSTEFGIQRYPIASRLAPDMILPNLTGNFFYMRKFSCENISGSASLYIQGVQNKASAWINGVYLGHHEGYSTPFEFNIPAGLLQNGENTVVLSVSNHQLEGFDGEPVSGLTTRAANYSTGGITGDIELRVYDSPLRDVATLISEDCKEVTAVIESMEDVEFDWNVFDGDKLLKSGKASKTFTFSADGLELWSPESPKLYTLELVCGSASLTHKFGVRRLVVDGTHLKLNGYPYFLRGICEHCYFPETVHPTHDIAYYRNIIKTIKKLGFNFIRFHTYIPPEEYIQAADELGMALHIESPNNVSVDEWKEIVKFARKHTSVVIYCCCNELYLDDPFIAYLNECADYVHENTDSLFSPMSALRGAEYAPPEQDERTLHEPFDYYPSRMEAISKYSDVYSSYAQGLLSYRSLDADPEVIDSWNYIYNKPRISHEICIDGTYTDLRLKDRYKGTRIGASDMLSSIERHLEEKGMLKKAPVFFNNSSEWQRRVRKYCFEATRRCEHMAGFDFLGPIDTHWHTFGYDVGMMNEFYELKPGETVRNVLMYNSETVLLTDIARDVNYLSEEKRRFGIYASYYGKENLLGATLNLYLMLNGKVIRRESQILDKVETGHVSKLCDWEVAMPKVQTPQALKLYVTLDGEELFAENEWEIAVFPKTDKIDAGNLVVSTGMSAEELENLLTEGKDVVLLGAEPFVSLPTTFRITLAGRTAAHPATIINDHPIFKDLPHDGYCGWQFNHLLEKGASICFENERVPFNPIIEMASSHKFVVRQSVLFEFNALNGRLLVCSFNFNEDDPAANWLKSQIISYAKSDDFTPQETLDKELLHALINGKIIEAGGNVNLAFNPNDIASRRRKSGK